MRDPCQMYKLPNQTGIPPASWQHWAPPVEMDFLLYFGGSLRSLAKGLVTLPSKQSVWEVMPFCRQKEENLSFIHLLMLHLKFHSNIAAFGHCWVFAGGCCFIAHPKHGYNFSGDLAYLLIYIATAQVSIGALPTPGVQVKSPVLQSCAELRKICFKEGYLRLCVCICFYRYFFLKVSLETI